MKIKKGFRYFLLSGATAVITVVCISAANPDFILGRNAQILFNMFRELSIQYVDPVDSDELLKNAAEGMVANLDPYTELIPESGMDEFAMQATGKYGGIGSLIHKSGDYVVISQPYKGFPADKAGLVIGDKIIKINSTDIKEVDATKVSEMLKGDPGSHLNLTIEKFLTGQVENISFKRERIVISGISYYGMVSPDVGYIVHSNFTTDCSSDIRKAVSELKGKGMKSLILDLRNNGGGIMQETPKIMSLFVPKNTEIVSTKGRTKESESSFKTGSEPIDITIPIAVLVNSMSASAAEIIAGAFQDLDRGVLIGQRTYGKGLVQSTRPLSFNAYVKLTTAKYYIPSGRCIQAIDYTHRNEDGSVGFIPDSLITEFTTAAGRKVYDGGGVMPDIKIDMPKYHSAFTIALYTKGYIEDFAGLYFKKHQGASVDVDTFRLSDADYADFVAFMSDKTVEFETETRLAIEALRKKAEKEKYLDRISGELSAMESKIKEDKASDLDLFKSDIAALLEDEIVMRYHYGEGVIRHNAHTDESVQEAIKLLADPARYSAILTTQNTSRK